VAEEILAAHAEVISGLLIVPGSGGVFTIAADGRRLYSKKETGRFPGPGEAARLVSQTL
jgi:selenoprotein W-related protein